MNDHNNHLLTANAQKLRKAMTKEEKHLWYDFLKKLPITVNRQKVFGRYILDFYIPVRKLAIELDGSQHYDDEGIAKDRIRENYLKRFGVRVLRYTNLDINRSFNAVCYEICKEIGVEYCL